jgi:dihydroorotate dehydrogenase
MSGIGTVHSITEVMMSGIGTVHSITEVMMSGIGTVHSITEELPIFLIGDLLWQWDLTITIT